MQNFTTTGEYSRAKTICYSTCACHIFKFLSLTLRGKINPSFYEVLSKPVRVQLTGPECDEEL